MDPWTLNFFFLNEKTVFKSYEVSDTYKCEMKTSRSSSVEENRNLQVVNTPQGRSWRHQRPQDRGDKGSPEEEVRRSRHGWGMASWSDSFMSNRLLVKDGVGVYGVRTVSDKVERERREITSPS